MHICVYGLSLQGAAQVVQLTDANQGRAYIETLGKDIDYMDMLRTMAALSA